MVEDRLDPVLQKFAAARTDLSPSVLGVVRDPPDHRRAEAAPAVAQMWRHKAAGEPIPADAVPARAMAAW